MLGNGRVGEAGGIVKSTLFRACGKGGTGLGNRPRGLVGARRALFLVKIASVRWIIGMESSSVLLPASLLELSLSEALLAPLGGLVHAISGDIGLGRLVR